MASRALSALGTWCLGKRDGSRVFRCMGLSSVFVLIPPPSGLAHRANDCLPALVDVHVLDGNFLLPLPAIALQCLGLRAKIRSNFVARFPLLSCSDTVSDPVKRRSARVAAKFVATAQSRVIGCRSTVFRSRARALAARNYRFSASGRHAQRRSRLAVALGCLWNRCFQVML
jgi:hypothetical protein